MLTTYLRKVGGSVMLTMPPALLDLLNLKAGSAVGIFMEGDRLVVEAVMRPRYSLTELLDASDYAASPVPEDRDWLDDGPSGGELI